MQPIINRHVRNQQMSDECCHLKNQWVGIFKQNMLHKLVMGYYFSYTFVQFIDDKINNVVEKSSYFDMKYFFIVSHI